MTGILLSGGMDSLALLYWLRPAIAFTIDYGQLPAAGEIRASEVVAKELNIRHEILRVDLSALGSGDLVGKPSLEIAPAQEWWPYRNQMLVSIAAMRAVTLGVKEMLVGTVLSDGFHADGTPEFVDSISNLLSIQEGKMTVRAPAIRMNTVELVRASGIPRNLMAWSHSCHTSNFACGNCRGCCKHFNVTADLGWYPH